MHISLLAPSCFERLLIGRGHLGVVHALLQPAVLGSDQEAMLAYTNTSSSFTSHSKIMIAPVTYWADGNVAKEAPGRW